MRCWRTRKRTAEVHAGRRARARDGRPVALAPRPLAEHAVAEAREPRVDDARADAVDPDEEPRVGDPEPLVRAHADAEEAERVRVEVVAPEVHGLLEARRAAVGGDEGLEVEGFLCWLPLPVRVPVSLRLVFAARRLHRVASTRSTLDT